MCEESDGHEAPTRRDYVKYGGAVVGGGLLAGCTGQSDSGSGDTPEPTETETSTDTAEPTETETSTDDGPYTVEMFPVGKVEFDEVPETWMANYRDAFGDMAVALGQVDGNRSLTLDRFGMWYDLLGIEYNADWPETWSGDAPSKEVYYELDCDVFFKDPNNLMWYDAWSESDVEEVVTNVGPFFGSYNRRAYYDGYEENAPTMLEAFEKVGQVFKQPERTEAMLDLHTEFQTEIESRTAGVDPVDIGLINGGSDPSKGTFYPMDPTGWGYEMKHYRDLGVGNAFEGVEGGEMDYEGLLEVDPEYIVVHWAIVTEDGQWDPNLFRERWVNPIANDPVGQELTAVKEDTIIPGAWAEQGPIINLFSTEVAAQTLYPEQFGEFPWEQYPEVPEENRLFDRQRVRDIVNGNI